MRNTTPKKLRGLFLITFITAILCGVTAGSFFVLTFDLPQIQALESFKPSATTRIYAADGALLGELYIERRTPVALSQIPAPLITALLTTEDRDFYKHSGIAIKGIVRAAVQNMLKGRFAQGASTLTQQLAKTLFLTPRKTFIRKLREAVLALQMERRYTKKEILALYLNQIYLGSGAYGVSSAATIYFNKTLSDLTLSECALIAGLAKAPSRYSPLVNIDSAKKRRDLVLYQMHKTGSIDRTTYQKAVAEPIVVAAPDTTQQPAPFFVAYVKDTLESIVGDAMMYKGGLIVHTTLSQQLQQAAQQALKQGLQALEQRMLANGISAPHPQGAIVTLKAGSGEILTMVGGRDYRQSSFNRAVDARRQPGSAMKPFVYALAIERGFDQTQTLLDAPAAFVHTSKKVDWLPENFNGSYEGEVSMHWALAHSKNIPAVRLLEKLGPSSVVQFCQALGITSPLEPNLTLALGSSEVNLLELTAAYAVFANHGKYISPYAITEIIDDDGNVIWRTRPRQHIAMSRIGAAIITDMLAAVITEGTGRAARVLPGPLAGKTGTTNDCKDALFIGYSPTVAMGVWVGNDDATPLGPRETGARAALPIWVAAMETAVSNQEHAYFDLPDGVAHRFIVSKSGRETNASASDAVKVVVKRPHAP